MQPQRHALSGMEAGIPWRQLEAAIAPYYDAIFDEEHPVRLSVMLRLYYLRRWFGYSDAALVAALRERPLVRSLAGIVGTTEPIPDETAMVEFTQLVEQHRLLDKHDHGSGASAQSMNMAIEKGGDRPQ